MRALVVYESMFGNTRDVALFVTEGLRPYAEVELVEVAEAPLTLRSRFDLVVLGAPTHAFGMSRPRTRADAVRREAHAPTTGTEVGIREWLQALRPDPAANLRGATFDTFVGSPRLPGSAAVKAHHALARHGFEMICAPERFLVKGTTGPLAPGEEMRARTWGGQLGRTMVRLGTAATRIPSGK